MIFTNSELDLYSGRDLVYPKRPAKPPVPKNGTSADFIEYAKTLEAYEAEKAAYDKLVDAYNVDMRTRNELFVRELKEYASHINDDSFSILYNAAYEDGHSEGCNGIMYKFESLVELYDKLKAAGL